MLSELLIRFLIGGLIVSVFAVSGDILRPKTFAGIFGAAPSVALASLGTDLHQQNWGQGGHRSTLDDRWGYRAPVLQPARLAAAVALPVEYSSGGEHVLAGVAGRRLWLVGVVPEVSDECQ